MAYWKENVNYRQKNGRHFITIDGKDVEVEQALYQAYTKMERRERYLIERERGICISLDAITNGGDYLLQPDESVEETVIEMECQRAHVKLLRKLRKAVAELTDEERKIIRAIYFDKLSIRKYAQEQHIPTMTLHYRLKNILKKLQKHLN